MSILLEKFETPFETVPFDKIKEEDFLPALSEAIKRAKKEIEKIKENKNRENFENVIVALENADVEIDRISAIFFNLHGAESNDKIQAIAKELSPMLTEHGNDVLLDGKLFEKVKKVYDDQKGMNLSIEEKMLLEQTYKSFQRNGALLSEEDKNKLREIDKKVGDLSLKFGDNVLAQTNDYKLFVESESDIKGLPEADKESAFAAAKEEGKEGQWLFTLQIPSFLPFMTYVENRKLRETLYKAFASRAFKDGDYDNKPIVKEIVDLRHQRAKLLGYSSHADFVLEERMAKSPKSVFSFLEELLEYAKPVALKEMKELAEYAKNNKGPGKLENWDYSFFSNKLKKELHQLDDEELRPYFKLENVIDGAFIVAEKLFGLRFIQRRDIPVYHEDVKTYEVINSNKQHVGVFYADFFPRAGKRSGAWMTTFRDQKIHKGKNVRPHVSIVCNFTKPTTKRPSLLTFDEVTTLFHEFGHGLHALLSNCRFESLSGTNVYWDFVELPSQILENWCYEKECLDIFAKHYETGEKIPEKLISRIKAASNFHEGRNTMRQLSFAYLDMAWHSSDPSAVQDVNEFERKAIGHLDLLDHVEGTNSSCAFSHIFQGGYSAGYYSYKWAEVLDADAFELFKSKGIFNREIGQSFVDNILSKGGSEHPMELYKRFKGEEPSPKALFKRGGLL